VVRALNDVAPYDWASLLRERVKATSTHAPLGGIERDGWRLVYNDKPNLFTKAIDKLSKRGEFWYSLGFEVRQDGRFDDVIVGSPAYKAGLGPDMKLVAVNGRKWTPAILRAALRAAQGSDQPIELLVENAQFFKTYSVDYHDGEKQPHLERIAEQADILSDVVKPLTR
jgi:predicted metalloprotease with PDZ domain